MWKYKNKLNLSNEIPINNDNLAEGEDFNITISFPRFKDLYKELFIELIIVFKKFLNFQIK